MKNIKIHIGPTLELLRKNDLSNQWIREKLIKETLRRHSSITPAIYISNNAYILIKKYYGGAIPRVKYAYSKFDKEIRNLYPLQFEHLHPVNQSMKAVIESDISIAEIIENNQICIITKAEHNNLTEKGYKSERPNGWQDAYEKTGINVILIESLNVKIGI